jgi:hypothetical protein
MYSLASLNVCRFQRVSILLAQPFVMDSGQVVRPEAYLAQEVLLKELSYLLQCSICLDLLDCPVRYVISWSHYRIP